MKIERYKYIKSGFYEIKLEDRTLILHEDCITKNKILLKKELSLEEIEKLELEQIFYKLKKEAVDLLNKKLLSKKELKEKLSLICDNKKLNEDIINALCMEGYLSDDKYALIYIDNFIRFKDDGPIKMKMELKKKGISEEDYGKYLELFTEEIEKEKIKKFISKKIKQNKNKSSVSFREKLRFDLKNKGFSPNLINILTSNIYIDDKEIRQKEEEKLYVKLSRKYSGKELLQKVKEKMYQKGFR